jgi:hypothetical protein
MIVTPPAMGEDSLFAAIAPDELSGQPAIELNPDLEDLLFHFSSSDEEQDTAAVGEGISSMRLGFSLHRYQTRLKNNPVFKQAEIKRHQQAYASIS